MEDKLPSCFLKIAVNNIVPLYTADFVWSHLTIAALSMATYTSQELSCLISLRPQVW